MKKTLLTLVLAIPLCALAQQKTSAKMKSGTQQNEDAGYKAPISFQVQAGTQGVGADVRYGVFKKTIDKGRCQFYPGN